MARHNQYLTMQTETEGVSVPQSFSALLRARALDRAEQPLFHFSPDGDADGGPVLTWGGLDTRAQAIAAWLQSRELAGARILLVFPPGIEFVTAFFGCLYAGAVAVPAASPRPNRPATRLHAIVEDAAPAALLTTIGMLSAARGWLNHVPKLANVEWLGVETVPDNLARLWSDPGSKLNDLTFLQYTSGSTATPKGVIVTHGNLLHNSELVRQSFRATSESRGVFWLPLFHDMGLIGGVLQTLYCGGFSTLMSPVSFLQRPVRWLEAITRTGATISGGPNFAYELCARKVTAEQKASLDLSRWTVAFNGAEPIRGETLDRFADSFESCGFRREAFLPCYGLAESTLMVSGKRAEEPPVRLTVRGAEFDADRAVACDALEPGARVLVGSGRIFGDLRVEIVDPTTGMIRENGHVGEILVHGSSVAAGYWGRPDATTETFRARLADGSGPFLRTGDLGFALNGELYVTGRRKDLMIVRGRNVYPQDVEWVAVGAHPLARAEGAAAFAIENEGEERLVVALEVERPGKAFDPMPVVAAVRAAIASQLDLDVYAICLLKPATLPKTSSGKVQRHACRAAFLAGTLDELARSTWDGSCVPAVPVAEVAARPLSEIEAWLVSRVAATLNSAPGTIDVRAPFATFGLGSLQAVALAGELQEWLGRSLSPTLMYEHPTIEALARILSGEPDQGARSADDTPKAAVGSIAIVGIGCRFPGGVATPEEFWSLLAEGVDTVGPPPESRRTGGRAGAKRAGFLDQVDGFDARFFGIAPREAVCTDPQQRLLLEVAWEAFEDAGLAADRFHGANIGVFLGISTHDYGRRFAHSGNREAYALTGNAPCIAANRVSYAFDFRGPSLTIDTACSSSLVALHMACESLRRGESSLVLAGGANLVLDTEITDTFSAGGFLAPDGRCKTFDASADGYVRGEGAGVVLLKPLETALADGDPIYAVIRGSAINQDGRSNGLTAPSREAQEAVLRAAYAHAGVSPGSIDYVEAHGTGTLLGDPIEAAALGAVLAEGRPLDRPCVVGSVKTNVGHLEAAAGIAGVIKTALALDRGLLPPSLHFANPNPHIPFNRLPIRVATKLAPWPPTERPRLAGVSSFGFGGTNAHAVFESAPPRAPRQNGPQPIAPFLVPLSTRSPQALRGIARLYSDRLSTPDAPALGDLAHTAMVRRSHHEFRLAVVAETNQNALTRIDAFLSDAPSSGVSVGRRPPSRRPRCAFVFSGQGGQWVGMARGLAEAEPIFRAALQECDRRLMPLIGWSVIEELDASVESSRLEETGFGQPAVYAIQMALTALWHSWGITPDIVIGHSLGEIAAAAAAGAIDTQDAARIVALRARLMQTTVGQGLAIAVGLSEADVAPLIAANPDRLALACINGPASTVLSGDPDAITALKRRLLDAGVAAKILGGRCAFHSPQMDPLRDSLRAGLAGIQPRAGRVPFHSSVTAGVVAGVDLGADYWARNIRETVRFADAVGPLQDSGIDVFLEIGPHPALGASMAQMLAGGVNEPMVLGSLRRGVDAREGLLQSLGALYCRGFDPVWSAVSTGGSHCRLPLYPFQRESFWIDDAASSRSPTEHVRTMVDERCLDNGHMRAACYEIEWRTIDAVASTTANGRWLLLGDSRGVADALKARLEALGAACEVFPEGNELFESRLDAVAAQGILAGVVYLAALDVPGSDRLTTADLEASRALAGDNLLAVTRTFLMHSQRGQARLWAVTSGAQSTDSEPIAVAQAPIWGLGRSLALEAPEAWGCLIDLDPNDPIGSVPALTDELLGESGEDQVAIRRGVRRVARLVPRERVGSGSESLLLRPEGTYLLTGGLGELGLKTARWLVEHGARRLVLASRRGLPDHSEWMDLSADHPQSRAVAELSALERQGATVYVAAVDIADPAALSTLLSDLKRSFPPLRGVIHAAGTVDDRTLEDVDAAALGDVFGAKAKGAWALHERTQSLPLDWFVMYSSVAGIVGSKSLHYAAANQFLDALAHHRRTLGLPALSVAWGPWSGDGMASTAERARAFAAVGMSALQPDDALDALGSLVAAGVSQATVVDADWNRLHDLLRAKGRGSLLNLLITPTQRDTGDDRTGWRSGPVEIVLPRLLEDLRRRFATVLKTDPQHIDVDRPVDAMGLDSLMAIELKNSIETDLGASLPLASLLRGPTLEQLAEDLLAGSLALYDTDSFSVSAPIDGVSVVALSVGQRALWTVHQLDPSSPAYHVVGAVKILAPLDSDALQRAAQRLVDRHPALRTTFPTVDGVPSQQVQAFGEVSFSFEDAATVESEVFQQLLESEAARPFDLESGPLFRIRVFRRSSSESVLLLALHHIISDFWSVAILLDELSALYPAELVGLPLALPPVPEFAEFVRREAALLQGPECALHREFWRDALAGPLPVLNLPMDRPRPAVQTYRGAARKRTFEPMLTTPLVTLGRRHGASLYLTMLAGFQLLMARLSGQNEVIVGSPVAGRDKQGAAGVVGYFVNALPLRCRIDLDESFDSLLTRIRADVMDALDHQALPFGVIAEQLQLPRDTSRSPIFQTMFAFQQAPRLDEKGFTAFVLRAEGPRMELAGFPVESIALELQGAQFDLTVMAAEDGGRIAVSAEYNTDLFDAATIDRLLSQFETLLTEAADDSTQLVRDLPLSSVVEREQLARWSEGDELAVGNETFVNLFETQAARTPSALAVAAADESLTYGQLNARANGLARRLVSLGVGPEDRVAVLAGRSAQALVGILGVLKAGAGYVPLDPQYPAARLAFMLQDCGAAAIVVPTHEDEFVADHPAPVLKIDDTEDDANPASAAAAHNLAYVIYTSGSTGTPKGVLVSHANLAASTRARFASYEEPVRGYLLVSSFAFDSSVAGIFWTLGQGGALVVPKADEVTDPLALASLVRRHELSHLLAVPSLYGFILEHAPASELESLRAVIVAGEPCPSGLPDRHATRLPKCSLFNEYGPTEATVWATVERCEAGDSGSVSIGRPIPMARVHVLDGRMNETPIGVTGELYIGGAGVARGYLGRPGLTSERFVADPFSAESGARLYRTGDLARWRPDGRLDCLGRVDGQVKIRGHRIELGEVEAALSAHPGVLEAAAAARADGQGEARLVAYLVSRPGETLTAASLRAWLKARLPDALMPTSFSLLDDLPRSPNGKVDRALLPDPSLSRLAPQADGDDPRNPAEAELAALSARLLDIARVGVDNDLFELGFDSIRAIQLVARARARGLVLTPAQVFSTPTVAGLALVARSLTPEEVQSRPAAAASSQVADEVYTLTPLQQGMLLHARLHPRSGAYVQQLVGVVHGALNTTALEDAWNLLTERHAVLRTSFGWDVRSGEPFQVVHRKVDAPFQVFDWRGINRDEQRQRLDDYLSDDRRSGLDSATAPLSRVSLFRLAEDESRLAWTYHHLLVDGWCLQSILHDLLAFYAARVAGEAAELPPIRPFREYVEWVGSQDVGQSESYWRELLKGFRAPTALRIEPPVLPSEGDADADHHDLEETRLSATTTAALVALGRRYGVTLGTIVQGAWAVLLSRYSGDDDVVFGTTVSGRSAPIPGVEQIVGPLINTLPVRARIDRAARVVDWFAELQRSLVEARRFEATPLSLALGWSEVPRGRPLFETLVVFENYPLDHTLAERAGGFGFGSVRVLERTEYPLTLMAFPGPELGLRLTYDERRFDGATVDRMMGHLAYLLEGIAADPCQEIDALSLAPAAEISRTLAQWNEPRVEPRAFPRRDANGRSYLVELELERDLDRLSDEDVDTLIDDLLDVEEASHES
jgi:amino acid adenylation domain-containing protein